MNKTKLKEITFRYLTDTIPYGALYITDKGRICDLSMLENGHADFWAELDIENVKEYLERLGWIKANTKLGYIDGAVKPTKEQEKILAKVRKLIFPELLGTPLDLIKPQKEEYKKAVANAFGNYRYCAVTQSYAQAKAVIKKASQNDKNFLKSYLAIDALKPFETTKECIKARKEKGVIGLAQEIVVCEKRFEKLAEFLLANTLVCDTEENARRILTAYGCTFKIVCLNGTALMPDGRILRDTDGQDAPNYEKWKGKSKLRCTMCDKPFDSCDEQEDFSFLRYIGYGSKYDRNRLEIRLCCACFDRVMDKILPMFPVYPMREYHFANMIHSVREE